MPVAYESIVTPLTTEQAKQTALDVLKAASMPTTSWQETSEPRSIVEVEARAIADVSKMVATIGAMATLAKSTGAALTFVADDVFDETRKAAVTTKGTRKLRETSGLTRIFAAGDVVITAKSNPGLVFRNEAGFTLAGGATDVAVTFVAEAPGAKYNVDGSELGLLATPIPGVEIIADTGVGWITQSGADEESDEALRARCALKWSTLTTTGPTDAYKKWALDASPQINRAHVIEVPTAVYPTAAVRVIIASTTGVPVPAVVIAADTYIQERRPLGIKVDVEAAVAFTVSIRGDVRVTASQRTAAEAKIKDDLRVFFETAPLGATIYLGKIIDIIMSVAGVVDVDVKNVDGTPRTTDWVLAANSVASLDLALTFISV